MQGSNGEIHTRSEGLLILMLSTLEFDGFFLLYTFLPTPHAHVLLLVICHRIWWNELLSLTI